MPSDKDWAEEGTSAPAAGTSPVPEAEPLAAAEHPGSGCPGCQAARSSQGCLSSCTHCFCPPCIEEWSHSRFSCPYCQQPLHHPFPRQGVRCQERHHGHGPSPPRSDGRWAARGSYPHPSGQSRPGRGLGGAQARGAERGGRRRAGRRWQDEAERGWGQDVLASPRSRRQHWRPGWGSSGQRRAAGSRSRRRSRGNRSRARGQRSRRHRRRQRRRSRHQDNAPAWHRPRSRQSHGRGREMHARQAAWDPSARHRRQRSRREQREEQAAWQEGHRSRRHGSRPWHSSGSCAW